MEYWLTASSPAPNDRISSVSEESSILPSCSACLAAEGSLSRCYCELSVTIRFMELKQLFVLSSLLSHALPRSLPIHTTTISTTVFSFL